MTNPTTVAGQRRARAGREPGAAQQADGTRGAPVGQLDVRQKLGEAIQNGSPEREDPRAPRR